MKDQTRRRRPIKARKKYSNKLIIKMVKMKSIPSEDVMRNTTVDNYFPAVERTTKDKNEEKLSKNDKNIEVLDGINTNDNNDNNAKIDRTEEAVRNTKLHYMNIKL